VLRVFIPLIVTTRETKYFICYLNPFNGCFYLHKVHKFIQTPQLLLN